MAAAIAAACDDPFAVRADAEVNDDTLFVFALSGTPLGFPTSLDTWLRQVVRVDPSFGFDVAFDIDQQARARIIPVRLVGGTATQSRVVGLQKATRPFDEIVQAPSSGYSYDSVVVLQPGEAVIVQALRSECALFINQYIYSKLSIDSVAPSRRTIYFRFVQDPNCGFRSLAPGVPKN
jgi:hypothetical protein